MISATLRRRSDETPQPRLELVPFADIISAVTDSAAPGLGSFVNIFGNIALLFPLGLLLPLFWRWFERAGRTLGWCFGTSLSIELIQLVAGGVTSADDLLLIRSAARWASRRQSC